MRMPELKALVRERGLRGYSQWRKAELIAFLQNNENLNTFVLIAYRDLRKRNLEMNTTYIANQTKL